MRVPFPCEVDDLHCWADRLIPSIRIGFGWTIHRDNAARRQFMQLRAEMSIKRHLRKPFRHRAALVPRRSEGNQVEV